MKYLKKSAALLLALIMILALSAPALADTNYTITISNPVMDETYSAYKIFDATVQLTCTDNTHTDTTHTSSCYAVSYTISTSSGWWDAVSKYATSGTSKYATTGQWTQVETAATVTGENNYTNNGLTLTPSAGDTTKYVVAVTAGFSAADFADYLITYKGTNTATGTATPTKGNDGTISGNTISVGEQGYYLVDTTLGALCALDTAMNVTIYEKNSAPTIDKQVFNPSSDKVYQNDYTLNADTTNGNGAWEDVYTSAENHNSDPATVDVCQTVYYKLVVNTGNWNGYAGTNTDENPGTATGVDDNYTIVDTLPTGFTIVGTGENGAVQAADIEIKSGSDTDAWTSDNTTDKDGTTTTTGGYSVTYTAATNNDAATLTITLNRDGKLGTLPQDTDITITYATTMTNNQVVIGGAGNENTAKLTYKEQKPEDSATVKTYQIGGEYTPTGETTPKPKIQKVDGTDPANPTPLAGVKFVLSKTVNNTPYYATVDKTDATTNKEGSYYLTGWTETKPTTGNIVTSNLVYDENDNTQVVGSGSIEVKGLDAGTYTLTEVETLPGYNLMEGVITIVIAEDGTVKYYQPGETPTTGDTDPGKDTIQIVNKTGTELPSTGGMGTTIFYVIGAILVLGAAVLLITRRRMNADK